MEQRTLGSTGLEVTRIGFGGIPIQRLSMADAVAVLRRALDLGCGLIDTARVYTDSEEKIGAALQGRTKLPAIATKTYSRDADGARRDVDISLANMGIEHVDVYFIHNVGTPELLDEVMGPGGALEGLRRARDEGLVGHVGISSHKPPILEIALEREALEVVEVPFSAIEQESLPVLEEAARRGVGTIGMKPLAGGALSDAAAALKFVMAHPVDCVIPGMQTPSEVDEDLAAAGTLSQQERDALLAEAASWGDRFCRRCEYCMQTCPRDVNITLTLLFASYAERYGLTVWAHERYGAMPVKADACIECGKCEERCPYGLPIRQMLKDAHKLLS